VFSLFHIIIPPGQLVTVGEQYTVEEEYLVYPLYFFIGVAFARLYRMEHGGIIGGPVPEIVFKPQTLPYFMIESVLPFF